jgi:quercetin dioxygenase-like cupin family protein
MESQPAFRWAATDPVKVDPKHYKVEFENDEVRVLRITFGPREKSSIHTHPAMVAIFLTDHHSRHLYSDGTTEEIKAKAGELGYIDAWEHNPENLSDRSFEMIAVELKG